MHEAQMHEQNCFITLTYNGENFSPSLRYSDFQRFFKRLRKHTKQKVRFYMAGEYGSQNGRPHFHACLFGWAPPDAVLFKNLPSGSALFTSQTLERLWPHGFSSVGALTLESAAYVARYCMKKITGPNADDHYWAVNELTGELTKIEPEFNHMSLKPGIGRPWYDKYKSDIYPNGTCIVKGTKMKPPSYYEKLYKQEEPYQYETLQHERKLKLHPGENTPERRQAIHEVTKARVKLKKRGFS